MSEAFARLLERHAEIMGIEDINDPKVVAAAQEEIDQIQEQMYGAEKENKAIMTLTPAMAEDIHLTAREEARHGK